MSSIKPKGIMLGRGSTCYNNPGNKAFRKVIKKHVIYYGNQASRKEKAALVVLFVSKLEAKGYRFLQQSTTGTWVLAPPHLAENKVAHSLRDARIDAAKISCDVNVRPPQDLFPDSTEPKHRGRNKAYIDGEKNTKEEMIRSKSDNTAVIIDGWAT